MNNSPWGCARPLSQIPKPRTIGDSLRDAMRPKSRLAKMASEELLEAPDPEQLLDFAIDLCRGDFAKAIDLLGGVMECAKQRLKRRA